MAVVVARPGETVEADAVIAYCREKLAGYKAPKLVEVIDQLPKNASGKVLKRDLRIRFADRAQTLG